MSQLLKDSGLAYLDQLTEIVREDVEGLKKAQQSYGNSWKQRGGVGAYMMLARKWDRLENRVSREGEVLSPQGQDNVRVSPYDIFAHIAADTRSEGVIDDVRDLRRYLILVEAEMRARGLVAAHRDNVQEQRHSVTNVVNVVEERRDDQEG